MERYFVELSYNGTGFAGWQRQPNAMTVQQHLEESFKTILESNHLSIVGCGRTDAGVHARHYFAHMDVTNPVPENFLHRINRFIGPAVLIHQVYKMHPEAHARFDAIDRSYSYYITQYQDPFRQDTTCFDPYFDRLDIYSLNECARLILNYDEFLPFSKSKSEVTHYKCKLYKSQWLLLPDRRELVYEVQANRFLRGMVRLIVGCCRQVCLNKISLEQLQHCLEHQVSLPKPFSAPAQGLFFNEVKYPDGYLDNPVF